MTSFKAIIFTLCVQLSWQYQEYNRYKMQGQWSSFKAPRRIVMLMEQYTQEAEQRASEMQEMRFMYEESPHYEMGYIMHEIVDRFRKMVYHVRRPMEFQVDNVFITLKHTEQVQQMYFEIYHLVNMMHEISLKWQYVPEFANLAEEIDIQRVIEQQKDQKERDRLESRDRKKKQKVYDKMKDLADKMDENAAKAVKKNKYWPLDYGWEIQYWW